jgi:hypothetical protein
MAFKYGAHANLADMAANAPKGVPSAIYWNMINNPGVSFEQALDDYIETLVDDPLAGGEDLGGWDLVSTLKDYDETPYPST